MNVTSALVSFMNKEVMSKAQALEMLDDIRHQVSGGDDSITVGEMMSMGIATIGGSLSWVGVAFGLLGVLAGLLTGYLAF